MGLVKTEITLKNVEDKTKAKVGLITAQEIRQMTVNALVDTGAWTLVINEATRQELGLEYNGKRKHSNLANGEVCNYDMAGPVEVFWKDRNVVCEAVVLPKAKDVLLGAIPLEAMDLMVNPVNQEVVGVHGDLVMHRI